MGPAPYGAKIHQNGQLRIHNLTIERIVVHLYQFVHNVSLSWDIIYAAGLLSIFSAEKPNKQINHHRYYYTTQYCDYVKWFYIKRLSSKITADYSCAKSYKRKNIEQKQRKPKFAFRNFGSTLSPAAAYAVLRGYCHISEAATFSAARAAVPMSYYNLSSAFGSKGNYSAAFHFTIYPSICCMLRYDITILSHLHFQNCICLNNKYKRYSSSSVLFALFLNQRYTQLV